MKGVEAFLQIFTNPNTGKKSSSRVSYFSVTVAVVVLVFCCCFVLVYDTRQHGKIDFDYFTGIAEVIVAGAMLLLAVGIPKTLDSKWGKNNKKGENEEDK